MTPDSPKGPACNPPEQQFGLACRVYAAAHDIEPHQVDRTDGGYEDVARELMRHSDLVNGQLAGLLGISEDSDDGDIADALAQQRSELERLTAELALYRERDALTRKALQVDGDGPLQFAALIVRQHRDRAVAEVSRLREQLAAATATLSELVTLKDGPRDVSYHERKPLAWQTARVFLAGAPFSESVPATPQQDEDAVLFAVAQDRVRRDKGVRHTLEDVAAELELMDEGRPSGSERLAPQWREGDVVLDRRSSRSAPVPDDGGIPWHERHDAVMAERDDWRQACEEAEARNVHLLMLITDLFGDFRDAATKYSELVDEIPEHVLDLMNYWTAQRDREQQDAAQAARSEATPKKVCRVGDCRNEPGYYGWCPEHSCGAHPDGNPNAGSCQFGQDAPHDVHADRTMVWQGSPSPSLRKEGEDSE